MSTAALTAVTLAAAPVRTSPLRTRPVPSGPVRSSSTGAVRARAAAPVRPLRAVPVQDRDRVEGGTLVLTRRGRRTVRGLLWLAATAMTAVGLVLLWVAVAATVAPGAAAGDGGEGVTSGVVVESTSAQGADAVEVVVGPGDTLWEIARTHAPDRDPRSVVVDIVAANDLSGTGVQVGARLAVPSS